MKTEHLQKEMDVRSFLDPPRSQAIYGSLVETFEPYSRHYTMVLCCYFSKVYVY